MRRRNAVRSSVDIRGERPHPPASAVLSADDVDHSLCWAYRVGGWSCLYLLVPLTLGAFNGHFRLAAWLSVLRQSPLSEKAACRYQSIILLSHSCSTISEQLFSVGRGYGENRKHSAYLAAISLHCNARVAFRPLVVARIMLKAASHLILASDLGAGLSPRIDGVVHHRLRQSLPFCYSGRLALYCATMGSARRAAVALVCLNVYVCLAMTTGGCFVLPENRAVYSGPGAKTMAACGV